MRTEPPPSEAVDSGSNPPASAAAEPPLEPPGVRARFHGALEPRHLHRVAFRMKIFEQQRAVRIGQADRVLEVFHAERQAGQRSDILSVRDAIRNTLRVGKQLLGGPQAHDRIHLEIDRLDAFQRRAHQLNRRQISRPNLRSQIDGRGEKQIACWGGHHTLLPTAPTRSKRLRRGRQLPVVAKAAGDLGMAASLRRFLATLGTTRSSRG
jgi:hypothetical protein